LRRFLAIPLVLAIGCASIIDVKDLRAPPEEDASVPVEAGAPDAPAEAEAGVCETKEVTNLVVTPRGIHTALDETDVYFTRGDPPNKSAILRCSKCGCDKPTTLVSNLNLPAAIAVDDRYVYWTDADLAGSLNRAEKKDGSNIQTVKPIEQPIGVAVDNQFVYWTVIGGGSTGVATAGIWRANKADFTGQTQLTTAKLLPDDIVPYALAVDDTDVYYTTAPDLDDSSAEQPCTASNGTIRRVAKAGVALQTSVTLATGLACPIGIALSNDAIFWVDVGAGTGIAGDVSTRPKSGGTTTKLASSQGRPVSIVHHAGRLTWAAPAALGLLTCTLPACADVTQLAGEQHNPSGLSVDDAAFYWAVLGTVAQNFNDGALRRIALP
jgi:hypothetical protein